MNLAREARQSRNFKLFLQQELVERCRKNPRYSLRAFAKSLEIGPSALSDMLNGKRTITVKTIERLGLSLGLSLQQIDAFKKSQKTSESPRTSANQLKFQQLTMDTFALISDWYHYAILELIKVENFEPSTQWVAKSLGITKVEANSAVERLIRLKLIEVKNGTWVDASEGFTTNIEPGLTSSGSRKLQQQILEQSILALSEVPIEFRNHTSMTMAMDPADLPEAIEMIKSFRRELCEFLERNNKPKEVYQLAVSLFPTNRNQKSHGENI